MSPYQILWLSAHISKEKNEEREFIYDMVKMVCAAVNPGLAKKIYSQEEQEVTENSNFEDDIKSLDPNFDMSSVIDLLGDEDAKG